MNQTPCWIFYGTNEQNVRFVKDQVTKDLFLNVVRWVGGLPDNMSAVKRVFPETTVNSFNQFNCIFDASLPIDPDFFHFYQGETIVRIDNIFRRSKLFYRYVNPGDEQNHCIRVAQFVLFKLKSENVGLVIFFEFPHTLGAYITYLLCEFLNIRIIIRALSPFENRVFYTHAIGQGIPNFFSEMSGEEKSEVEQLILKSGKTYEEAQPSYTRIQRRRLFLVSKIRRLGTFIKQQRWKRALKSRVVPIESFLNHKFVYVGLHYQPELTSFPLGDLYSNQHLMIMLLSATLPPDWKIVVKEHPTTFTYIKDNMALYRSEFFYKSLNEIPKVHLVDYQHDSFLLLDKSTMVATLTGTLGFESVLRGKPALVFGDAPFIGCPGVYRIRDVDSLIQAIENIISTEFKVDIFQVHQFVSRAYANTVSAKTNVDYEKFDVQKHIKYMKEVMNQQDEQ